jgi:hypothetical protein
LLEAPEKALSSGDFVQVSSRQGTSPKIDRKSSAVILEL